MYSLNKSKKQISRKVAIQTYFIIFILLNVLDFLNLLEGDIDFFKKLLSWIVIGYVFYIASFTKIFVGIRSKGFDMMYMIAFSLMAIVKSLALYVTLESTQQANFYVFSPVIFWLENINLNILVQNSFIIGVLLLVLTSALVMRKYTPTSNSLIGSLKIKGFLKLIQFEFIMLTITATFFGLIVFNFFMEWFALAVDALILVIGLFYYIFRFIHDHTKTKASYYLQTISNTGNAFYKNILEQFSNKRTFFIGVSFILTLLLLVDVGVYIIPYVVGNQNSLYSANLDQPLLSMINPTDSRLFADISTGNALISFEIIIIYLSTIFLISILMILPFVYFYSNISRKKLEIPKILVTLILVSILIFIPLVITNGISYPISISESSSESSLYGVKISTSTVLDSGEQMTFKTIIISLILSFAMIIGYFFHRSKALMKISKDKILPGIVLIFFVIYILMFFYTTIKPDIENSKNSNLIKQNSLKSDDLIKEFENNENYKEKRPYIQNGVPSPSSQIKIIPFSTATVNKIVSGESHSDYLYVEINNIDTGKLYRFDINQIYFSEENIPSNGKFSDRKVEFIVSLGKDRFDFKVVDDNLRLENTISPGNLISVKRESSTPFEEFTKYLRLIFTSIFYMIGTLEFSRYFIRKNIV